MQPVPMTCALRRAVSARGAPLHRHRAPLSLIDAAPRVFHGDRSRRPIQASRDQVLAYDTIADLTKSRISRVSLVGR